MGDAGAVESAPAWDFAVELYGRPGVREACLDLQDRLGVDVVALLALVHRAASGGGGVGAESLGAAGASAPDAEAAREAVAQAELAAERAQLMALAHDLASDGRASLASGDPRARLGAAAQFLSVYWKVLSMEAEPADRQALAAVLAAAFPKAADHASEAVEAAFRS